MTYVGLSLFYFIIAAVKQSDFYHVMSEGNTLSWSPDVCPCPLRLPEEEDRV